MATYHATVEWGRDGHFLSGRYSRLHTIRFDGHVAPGSASPHIVPAPYSVEEAVDPEEMFVASISTCHMLWFLDYAKQAGVEVEAYVDEAQGVMSRNAEGKLAMTRVTLRPQVTLADPALTAELPKLHHMAHEACFIANSVKTEIVVEPRD